MRLLTRRDTYLSQEPDISWPCWCMMEVISPVCPVYLSRGSSTSSDRECTRMVAS